MLHYRPRARGSACPLGSLASRASHPQAVRCPECQYDLSAHRVTACPECGTRVTLQPLFLTPAATFEVLLRALGAVLASYFVIRVARGLPGRTDPNPLMELLAATSPYLVIGALLLFGSQHIRRACYHHEPLPTFDARALLELALRLIGVWLALAALIDAAGLLFVLGLGLSSVATPLAKSFLLHMAAAEAPVLLLGIVVLSQARRLSHVLCRS